MSAGKSPNFGAIRWWLCFSEVEGHSPLWLNDSIFDASPLHSHVLLTPLLFFCVYTYISICEYEWSNFFYGCYSLTDVKEEEKLSCVETGSRCSFIHPSAVVHPDAILGQVNFPVIDNSFVAELFMVSRFL